MTWLKARTFDVPAKIFCVQVALGLQAMHSLQPPVAHRDVKPHNVLLEARCTAGMDEADALTAQPLQACPAWQSLCACCHAVFANAGRMCKVGFLCMGFCAQVIHRVMDMLCIKSVPYWPCLILLVLSQPHGA